MRRRLLVVTLAALALSQTSVRAQSDSALVICKVITDRAAELVRTGETARARAMKPQLQECIRLQRAELDRAARRIVNEYDASVRN